ncbi:pyruvate carboxylase [Fusarium graminearum PH-1]|uniref:pyruvate carboxylase n=1 Tax=Gibberella zeae (strain ATCC MYA-4620 / CBS 123657 / FGSC 9075 / NRRL 31084 / PH-1) TaxID=229533 RepID=UPI000023F5D0|nr:pyruvate carboxylase [Fusarium graminearum PH-1]ESU13268.1 pyruvate carboxylase [Fusarium graminearum PH-1]|eukprot:XP_011326775.1 pyruvate carboxylase [Fusarium graminearum PH-1]
MAAIAPQQPLTFNDVFEEEDIDEPKEANSVHHIRANSSIMHVKKILDFQNCRLQFSAHELSLHTVAVFRQKADEAYVIGKRGQYTPVGAYLAGDEIVKIAVEHGVQMIHPGYGFLSENAEFARKVEKAGLIFVGPSPEVIDSLGDKVSARKLANAANVPVVPGTQGAVERYEEVKDFTDKYGFPIIIKAAFGGGGRGMRVVREQESLKESFERATSEAKTAFGNGTVFVERFLDKPKHIEVQLLGDNHGNIVHLYERDCSVQRRHQKVVEIAPAKDLPSEVRDNILSDAVRLAKTAGYRNAGTAEFLVDQQNRHYFIEINPRIQVEHTITEEITGIDIVAAQIQIAAGATLNQLGLTQDRISTRGFAIQCRITTEDPAKGFQPDTGKIEVYRSSGGNGVRLDTGNGFAGAVITPHYDSMLTKCTCHGSTYEIARRKVLRSLIEFRIRGVRTNIPFLASLLTHPTFIDGTCWTTFIDDTPQLFDLVGSQNRAQKLLAYLGDVAVNGSSIKGQIGEPKFKGEIQVPEFINSAGEKVDTSQPCTKGWRNIILEQGPKAFAKAIREYKGTLLMDTTWRDAHQSLLATRVRTVDLLGIAKETSHALSNLYSLECWGGATFDVAMRFLYEDPWDRLRKMRKLVPNIPFQMLLRGANGVAYSSLPDNAIDHFVDQAKKNGVDIFRVFDALNDIDQLEVGIKAVQRAGGICEGTVSYSGDMLRKTTADPSSTLRLGQYRRQELLPFYVKKALDNGFSITHYGLLCWSPIPDLTRAASLRGLFLVLEAAFTLWFWPIASRTKDYGMPRLFPWDTSTLIHDGCCSHFPLIEGALGLSASLSPEQIAAVKVERRRKAQAWFHTQNRAYRRARDRGPVSRRKRRVLASKKFSCITCGLVFDCAFHKRRHEATKNHRNKAAGQQFKTVTRWTITYAKNRAAKRYYCQPCDYAAGSRTTLKSHCESKAHLQKAGDSFSFPSIMRIKGKTAAKRVADRKITAKENVESKKFYCQPCDYATTDRRNFNRHLRAQKHEDKVTGTVRVPKEPRTEERREQRAAARIAKLHYCEVCDYIAGTQQNLNSHFNTKPHQEKAKSHQKRPGKKYNLEYYLALVDKLVALDIDILGIKDMAGVLKPHAATLLIGSIREKYPDLPIHVHTHDSAGTGVASMVACAKAGADAVDAATDSLSGMTSQPSINAIIASLEGSECDPGLDPKLVRTLDMYWQQLRLLYSPFEAHLAGPDPEVYEHEIPGGQLTNMMFQASQLGLGSQWLETKKAYEHANELLGDIVKVTPTSKVVGDLAQFMVSNGLSPEDVKAKASQLDFPSSVLEFLEGLMGQPYGGFPEPLRSDALRGRRKLDKRPGLFLEPVDFVKTKRELGKKYGAPVTECDVASYVMYPKVFEDYKKFVQQYGDLSVLPTRYFLSRPEIGEEFNVELEKGKVLILKLLAVGPLSENTGQREVFFEMNGEVRQVTVVDKKAAVENISRPKADANDSSQVGAPMSGVLVELRVHEGSEVKKGDPIAILSAMKMEMSVSASHSGKVTSLHVREGDSVDGSDLICRIEKA